MRIACTSAVTKVISLSDDAYKALRKLKLRGESFSDAVLRLSRPRGVLSDVIGLDPELAGKTGLATSAGSVRTELTRRLG